MNLLEHTKASAALEDLILSAANADGEIGETEAAIIEQWADEVEGGLSAKLEAVGIMLRNLDAESEARGAEASRQMQLANAANRRAERLKAWVKFCLESQGIPNASGGLFTFSIAGNGGKAPLVGLAAVDPATLPERFQLPQPPKPDTNAIRAALEAGETIEGITIGQRGTSLRVKG